MGDLSAIFEGCYSSIFNMSDWDWDEDEWSHCEIKDSDEIDFDLPPAKKRKIGKSKLIEQIEKFETEEKLREILHEEQLSNEYVFLTAEIITAIVHGKEKWDTDMS